MDTLPIKGRVKGGQVESKIFQTNLKRSTSAPGSIQHRLENASSSSLARVEKEEKETPQNNSRFPFSSRYLSPTCA